MRGCGFSEIGYYVQGELLNCNFLLEGTEYEDKNSNIEGIYLETITPAESARVWHIDSFNDTFGLDDNYEVMYSIRPAITIKKSDLSSNSSD